MAIKNELPPSENQSSIRPHQSEGLYRERPQDGRGGRRGALVEEELAEKRLVRREGGD